MTQPTAKLPQLARSLATPKGALALVTLLLILTGAIFLLSNLSWPGALDLVPKDAKVSDRFQAHVQTGLWWATLANITLLALGLATARWWLQPSPTIPDGYLRRTDPPPVIGRKFLILTLLAAVILGAWMRIPRMDVSLYFDELHTMRVYTVGKHHQEEDNVLRFRPAKWEETFWLNRESNNHTFYSIASRLSLDLWKKLGLRQEGRMSETAARLPPLIAGLATIFLIGWFLHRLGFPIAGILAAFILALHPWHVRYSADARGYGMCLFFVTLMLLFLLRALRSGKWRDWSAYGACQFAALYSYSGSLYVPVAVNAVTFLALVILIFKRSNYPAKEQAIRLVVACIASAILFIQLATPNLIQMAEFIQRDYVSKAPRLGLLRELWAYLSSGMPWTNVNTKNPLHVAVDTSAWPAFIFTVLVAPLATLAGALRLSTNIKLGFIFTLALILPAPIGFLHAKLGGSYLHIWYLIFALPATVILLSLGLTWFGKFILRQSTSKPSIAPACLLAAAALALFAWLTHQQRESIRHNGKEPLKLVVNKIYGDIDPFSPEANDIITAGVWSSAGAYDPWLLHVYEPEHFYDVMNRSLDEGRPLYYTHGHDHLVRSRNPVVFTFIDNPKLFRPVEKFWGLEESQFNHYLLEFVGDRAAVEEMKNNPVAAPESKP
ncbi:MAG: glycosyltransferase family 39 protein [Verrucomicrobiota bacterium]